MDNRVYILLHCYEYGEELQHEEIKFIGVYSAFELANRTIERLYGLPGFSRYPIECFYIDEYTLDEDHWADGFTTWREIYDYQKENGICQGDEFKKSIFDEDE